MGMFRRRKDPDGRDSTTETDTNDDNQSTKISDELKEQAQEVMLDNLEMMRELVFRIREDPEFAKGIYKDCPRLQHLLNRYPDLRPIFEDPKLVRINFEEVYRQAGGILPEDEVDKKKKSWLVWFVNSPIFKVLKLLLFVKKLMACIAGGGIAMITGCFVGCCFEDALDEIDGDQDGDGDADGDGEAIDPNREALNRAADHMEDPDVQEQMEALLEDPDNMQEAIANDSDLQALRESNPLCDELMNDPDTMRVLTDPDNLRALGEAPSLIEADFIDPDSFMPEDIETGGFESGGDFDSGFDGMESGGDAEFGNTDADFDMDVDGDADDGFDGDAEAEAEAAAEAEPEAEAEGEGEGEEGEDGWWEDAELEEQESPDADADANTANKGKAQAKNKQSAAAAAAAAGAEAEADGEGGGGGTFRGILASVGVAATELIAAQVVGQIFDIGGMGDLLSGGGGGGDLGGLDQVGDDVGDAINDDVAGVAEDAVDETDEQAKEGEEDGDRSTGPDADLDDDDGKKKKDNTAAVAGGVAGGVAVAGAAGYAMSGSGKDGEDKNRSGEGEDTFEDEQEEEEPEKKKKSRFAFVGNFAATLATAAKEHIATAILGDDFGEALVERMEGGDEEEEDEKKKKKGEEGGEEEEEEKEEEPKKKRGLFRRNKS